MDSNQVKVVALGGGHGLAATLVALRTLPVDITAVVGVSDNGGSSGRLRADFDVIPPGDLRMALTALCGADEWGSLWARVLQHRFPGNGSLAGHSMGNLLITALWQQAEDIVAGLDAVSTLLGAQGRVLPLSLQPLDIEATVIGPDGQESQIMGQVQVATTQGRVQQIHLHPADAKVCPEALAAVNQADVIVLGPGSWFTSVLTHALLPEMEQALVNSTATKILVSNLCSQSGETHGFSPAHHLEALSEVSPSLTFDVVVSESEHHNEELVQAASHLKADLYSVPLKSARDPHQHDAELLAQAFNQILKSVPNYQVRG
ncbi:MAG: hypothetical protein RIS75_1202 [Actinomycetota bacterium]